jgi:hypothetical protein
MLPRKSFWRSRTVRMVGIFAVAIALLSGGAVGVAATHASAQIHYGNDNAVDGHPHYLVTDSGKVMQFSSVAAAENEANFLAVKHPTVKQTSSLAHPLNPNTLPGGGGGGWSITVYWDIYYGGPSFTFMDNGGNNCGDAYPYSGSSWINAYMTMPNGWYNQVSSFKVNSAGSVRDNTCWHVRLWHNTYNNGSYCAWDVYGYWNVSWVGQSCNDNTESIWLAAI